MRKLALLALLAAAVQAYAQPPDPKLAEAAKKEEIEQGLPVTNAVVVKNCSPCHKADEKARLTRISYRRTTPEGWEQTIKRMVSLNGVRLQPADAREIVRYLANNHGLAPEEAKPAAFEVERRMIEFRYTADKDTETTCIKCHSFGRVMSQRRTKSDWEALVAMHRGYYPLSDFQSFRRMAPIPTAPPPPGAPPFDARHPMDKAIAHLATAFPLRTPEWSAWSANMRMPKLAGRWSLSGQQPGKGPIYGQVTIAAKPGNDDEFTSEIQFVYARTGEIVKRTGRSLVYTGFQWRGRNFVSADKDPLREVMFVDSSMREIAGRWFTGAYEEIGMDVKLRRLGNDPVVLGLDRPALRVGTTGVTATIHGHNLPSASPADIDFGRGVKVSKVIGSTPDTLKVELDIAADAPLGRRDIFIAGASAPAAAVVFDRVDTIKVTPLAGMARVGGANFPKQFQQFEAIAYANGPDGKPDTKDDLDLGPVSVAWSIDEFTATYGDDDKEWVGKIDDNGLFTPNIDGPNPARRNGGNNIGDVWVVATYNPAAADKKKAPLRGRAHLLVTVPLYMRWDTVEAPE